MAPPVVIKKYGNRRLYDTGDSRYVTLDELAGKLRSGMDLRVVDAQTGEDLTQSTLVQIVLETGNAAKFLPVQLLTQMIRLSDDHLAEFFSRYVTSALDVYLQAKRGMQALTGFHPLSQWVSNPFGGGNAYAPAATAGVYPSPPYVAPPPPPEEPPPRDSSPAMTNDVAAMRRELDELKQAILASRPAPAKKKKSKS